MNSSKPSDSPFTSSELPDAYPIEDGRMEGKCPSFPIIGWVLLPAGGGLATLVPFSFVNDRYSLRRSGASCPGSSKPTGEYPSKKHHDESCKGGKRDDGRARLRIRHSAKSLPHIARQYVTSGADAPASSMGRAIDRLFISLAEEQQERAICIVLTGVDRGLIRQFVHL
jgi:two-component system CheB/CheR fusion protein